MKRDIVLKFLNETPIKFKSGRCKAQIEEKECLISFSQIEVQLLVSFLGEVFTFKWDNNSSRWI